MRSTLKTYLVVVMLTSLVMGCSTFTPEPTASPNSTYTPIPTQTPTSTMTPTSTKIPTPEPTLTPTITTTPINPVDFNRFSYLIKADPFFPDGSLKKKPDDKNKTWIIEWDGEHIIGCGEDIETEKITFKINNINLVASTGTLVDIQLVSPSLGNMLVIFDPKTCEIVVEQSRNKNLDEGYSKGDPLTITVVSRGDTQTVELEIYQQGFIRELGDKWCFGRGGVVKKIGIQLPNGEVRIWDIRADPPTPCPSLRKVSTISEEQ